MALSVSVQRRDRTGDGARWVDDVSLGPDCTVRLVARVRECYHKLNAGSDSAGPCLGRFGVLETVHTLACSGNSQPSGMCCSYDMCTAPFTKCIVSLRIILFVMRQSQLFTIFVIISAPTSRPTLSAPFQRGNACESTRRQR